MTTAWAHQKIGLRMIQDQPATMLAWDMGTGKTKAVVDAICSLPDCNRILVCCPKSVIDTWPEEFRKHGTNGVMIVSLRGGSVAQRTKLAIANLRLAKVRNQKIVLVINYEAVRQSQFGILAKTVVWDMIVCDEIHKIKSPGGKISRFLYKLNSKRKVDLTVPYSKAVNEFIGKRVGLSGTPMPHSPLDVYAQYRFLDSTIFGLSFTRFRSQYAVMGGYENHQVLRFQNQDELHNKFYSIAHRVKKEDVLDLPDVIHERRSIQLDKEGARIYREVEHQFIADVQGGKVTAANALAKLLRLQQITSGFAKIEGGDEVQIDQGKSQALLEIMEGIDPTDPIVVFCRFRHDLQEVHRMAAKAKRCSYELSGKANNLGVWKQVAGGNVLAVQIQAGGVGVDLSRAAYCVYFSLGFSLGDYLQSMARLHRPGQTRSVTYLHLITRGTVDEKVYKALEKRQNVIESILKQIKESK